MCASVSHQALLDTLYDIGIIPVIQLDETAEAGSLARALIEGGIPCAEVTFRAAGADEVISRMRAAYPDMLVGAGTVLTTEQAGSAIAAGAQFLVAPGFNRAVAEYVLGRGVPFFPGVSGTEGIEQAMALGLDTVKFFPAEQSGGLAYLKAVAAPYAGMRFIPTGGISIENLAGYLSFDRVVACGGSFMVKKELLARHDYAAVASACRQAVDQMIALSVDSITSDEPVGYGTLLQPSGKRELLLSARSVPRALLRLKAKGFLPDPATARTGAGGRLTEISFFNTFGGLPVRLISR